MKALVTGATGLIGSFTVEALVARGYAVRALVRESSDLSDLEHLDVELFYGDMTDARSLSRAVEGVDYVFHSAARMNDWGPWKIFYEHNVLGTRNLLDAAMKAGVQRFVHVSSTGVTGVIAVENADETAPVLAVGNYEESKALSEQIALDFYRERGFSVTVVRPCWSLGPRARRHIPLMVDYIGHGKLPILGRGDNVMSFVDPRDAAEAMILAAERPEAAGQIYHVTNDDNSFTQAGLYALVAEELGVEPPSTHVPLALALLVGWVGEKWALLWRWDDAPMLTPLRVNFLARPRYFTCAKAMRELGYRPRFTLRESIRDAIAWYREKKHVSASASERRQLDLKPSMS